MKAFANILWLFLFGGIATGVITLTLGVLLVFTVVLAPIGFGLLELGKMLLWPVGQGMVSNKELGVEQNTAIKSYSFLLWLVYLPIGLIFAAIGVLQIIAAFIAVPVTFGGSLPAGIVVAKSLSTYLNPVDKKCVDTAILAELKRRNTQQAVDDIMKRKEQKTLARIETIQGNIEKEG